MKRCIYHVGHGGGDTVDVFGPMLVLAAGLWCLPTAWKIIRRRAGLRDPDLMVLGLHALISYARLELTVEACGCGRSA